MANSSICKENINYKEFPFESSTEFNAGLTLWD